MLYNGERRWKAPVDVGELIAPVGSALAPYQPSQRYLVLDERHVARDDLSEDNLMAAVVGLEQSRSPADLARVAEVLWERLRDPRHDELGRAFVGWMRCLAERFAPGEEEDPFPVGATLEDVRMTLEERVAQWPKQWFQEGREEGREEGLAHERALLRRMATSRFGAGTAERLSETLARIADPDRLADIGEWLVRCDTGEEFLARAATPAADLRDRSDG